MTVASFALPASAFGAAGPAQPAVVGALSNTSTLSGATAVAVSGHYAYTTAYWPGELTVVDISNPSSPQVVGNTPPPTTPSSLQNASNITIAGNYAFVVSKNRNASFSSNDDGSGNSLTVVDISNPTHPTVTGKVRDINKLFGAYGIAVSGNYAYVAYQGLLGPPQPQAPDTSKGGFSVIDLTTMTVVANIDDGSLTSPYVDALEHATSVAISGNYAYVNAFNNSSVTVVNITTPTNPSIVATLHDPTDLPAPVDLAVKGNDLYVVNQAFSNQFTVIDISNPNAPTVVSSRSASELNGAYRIRIRGSFAYVSASRANTIAAIDLTYPTTPRLAGFIADPRLNFTTGLDVDSTGAYVVATSPFSSTESNIIFPPYPDPTMPTAPTNTGTLSVIQLDPAPISISWVPALLPPNPSSSGSVDMDFNVSDAIYTAQCSLDGAPLTPCPLSNSWQASSLPVGPHTLTVQVTDTAGNTAHTSYSWVIGTRPVNSSRPHMSGTAIVGYTVTATTGSWSSYPAPAYSYAWQRCDLTLANCGAIAGATGPNYTLQQADAGHTLRTTVTATNSLGASSSSTGYSSVIRAAPASLTQLSVSGTPVQGNTLKAQLGSWAGYPAPTLIARWQRCNRQGRACSYIAGATGSRYVPSLSEVGSRLRVTVTGVNGLGRSTAQSGLTGVVVSNATASFTGIARGVPGLHVTITGASGAARIKQVTVILPSSIIRLATADVRTLAAGVVVRNGANRRLRDRVTVRSGALVITLAKPAANVRIVLSGGILEVKRSFAQKTKRKRKPTATLVLAVMETHGVHTHDQLQARAS